MRGVLPRGARRHGAGATCLIAVLSRINAPHRSLVWEGTSYDPAIRAVIDHYRNGRATDPAFVVFRTEGSPPDRRKTRELLRSANAALLFWQFVGFGPSRNCRFLRSLDTPASPLHGQRGLPRGGPHPETNPDADLFAQLLHEYPAWLTAAAAAGITPEPRPREQSTAGPW